MEASNGISARLGFINEQLKQLWDSRASKESVKNVEKDVEEIKSSIKDLTAAFRSLQIAILVACVTWALGSAGFIIGVLALTGK